jgi:DNA mismatch endonuclease, patch repair protein
MGRKGRTTIMGKRRVKAGHRSWAARGQRVPGRHTGDIMSAETRSRVMARIRGSNTGPENTLASLLAAKGIAFRRHAVELPGRPDFVFQRSRLAVFVDGDFWHGWRFPLWRHKLSEKWAAKIHANRARDRRNHRRLRRSGWVVLRIWEHEIENSPSRCVQRILALMAKIKS